MGRINKKQPVNRSVLEMARTRLADIFDRFDRVAASFSGGKDSTVCLNLALEVATQLGRLPLPVFTFDEEVIPPETVEYCARVAARPDVAFTWYCVPIFHRNACSPTQPSWHPWAPEDQAQWVRELPAQAVTDFPGFTRQGIAEQMPALFQPREGTAGIIMGIRAQESMSRYRAVASKAGHFAYMTPGSASHITNCYPIYDWHTEDVWRAPAAFGWDYNRAYDVMDACGMPRHAQRCAPPFGEQPIRGLYTFKTCWPQLWAKMVDRVPGAATAARYANTELYAVALSDSDLPEGTTWREWTMLSLQQLPPDARQEAADAIRSCLVAHQNRTPGAAVPDAEPHPVSGYCWRMLFTAAKVGGNKFGRIQQKIANAALAERRARGITS
jgi:predicted phosphoadenosine phosphosulfate sulfurtransferase